MSKKTKLFLQFEGHKKIELIEVAHDARVSDVLVAATHVGFCAKSFSDAFVFSGDSGDPLSLCAVLSEVGICSKHRVHIHSCKRIEVTVNFNGQAETKKFPPSATIDKVKKRFVNKFELACVDASEHVLQICCTDKRPEPDCQIGALVSGCCEVCFDLVPIKRVEG